LKQKLLLELPKIDQRYFENDLGNKGISVVAGVDEVGRGCLAGPVLAASVILPSNCGIQGINDSKKLSPKERDRLFDIIIDKAVAYGVGVVEAAEIDRINILQATLKAMSISLESLNVKPQFVLIDGNQALKDCKIPQKVIVKGDSRSISVGAASIVAKVTRDRMMAELENKYPNFKFSIHKGYGTKLHLEELAKHGPTAIHRKSFGRVSS